jgi:hypothetical protein
MTTAELNKRVHMLKIFFSFFSKTKSVVWWDRRREEREEYIAVGYRGVSDRVPERLTVESADQAIRSHLM